MATRTIRHRLRARWAAARADDSGAVALEAAVVVPVLLIVAFALIQIGLYQHANNVAQSVANGAVQVARIDGGTDQAGYAEAHFRLSNANGGLPEASVSIARGAQNVTVTVTGKVVSIVPLLPNLTVSQTATGAIERFEGQP